MSFYEPIRSSNSFSENPPAMFEHSVWDNDIFWKRKENLFVTWSFGRESDQCLPLNDKQFYSKSRTKLIKVE